MELPAHGRGPGDYSPSRASEGCPTASANLACSPRASSAATVRSNSPSKTMSVSMPLPEAHGWVGADIEDDVENELRVAVE